MGGCTTLAIPLCPCGPELTGALGLAVGAGAEGQGSPRRGGRGLQRRGRMPLAASQVSPVVCGRLAQARGGAAQGSGSASCLLSSPWWSGSHLPARFGRALEPVEHLMLRRVGTPRRRRGRRERGDEAGRGARSSPHVSGSIQRSGHRAATPASYRPRFLDRAGGCPGRPSGTLTEGAKRQR